MRVPLGIPTALFPMPRGFDPVRSLLKTRLALYKDHFVGNHLWESLGRSYDQRFRPDSREPTRNPKAGLRTKKLNQSHSHTRRLMQHNQVARESRTRLNRRESALKPMLGSEIEKYEDDQEISHGWVSWHTGAKFFKRVLKNFGKEIVRLS